MAASTQTRTIVLKVDSSGTPQLKEIADYMGRLNSRVKDVSNSFGFLRNAFLGYLSLNGLKQLAQVSDTMQSLNNRLVTITGSQEEASRTMTLLLNAARDTNTSIDAIAESYARLGVALKGVNPDQRALVDLTKVLTNTFRLSGATTTETTNTIHQLSQAYASGQLRGQELRSVMEQNAVVAEILRKELGKDIYKQAKDGAISAAVVIRALAKNMDEINAKAQLLTPTIEQSLAKAFNNFKVAILNLNQEFNVSGKFAKMLDFLAEKLPLIIALIGVLAFTQIPALGRAIGTLVSGAAATNVWVTAFVTLASVSLILIDRFDGLDRFGMRVTKVLAQAAQVTQSLNAAFYRLLSAIGGNNPFTNFNQAAEKFQSNADGIGKFIESLTADIAAPKKAGIGVLLDENARAAADMKRRLEELAKQAEKYYGGIEGKAPKVKELLAELNQQFLKGAIDAKEYNSSLISFNFRKLTIEFEQGKINLDAFNKGIQELNRQDINRAFSQGAISLNQFNQAIATSKLKDLKADLESGKISLIEYRMEFVKLSEELSIKGSFQAGAANYITSIGTIGQQTAQVIQNAFQGLETVFFDFIKKGKFSFKDFTQSVLDDLTKIIIRAQIVKPLANAVLSLGAPSVSNTQATNTDFSSTAALGNVYSQGNLIPFARGGVVGSPTTFAMSKGRTGLMGEAGPEAIMPLSRGAGGKLGVAAQVTPVTVNVINQAGAEVQQQETTGPNGERTIDLIIANKVKEQFANGTYDKTLRTQYGISRKGQ